MAKKLKSFDLGTIELKDKVVVSDPCYSLGVGCSAILSGVKPGKWFVESWGAYADSWDGHMLVVRHESYKAFVFPKEIKDSAVLGIDSGQVGIYDLEEYRNDSIVDKLEVDTPIGILEDDVWYSYACHLGDDVPAKLVGNGVTSESGYGDGSAQLIIDRNSKGEIIRIGVNF